MALDLPSAGTSARPRHGAPRGGGALAVVLPLCTISLLAGAALLGYWQHQPGTVAGQAQGSISEAGVETVSALPLPYPAGPVGREEIIDERIQPRSRAVSPSTLRWPMWEFQLRQPIPPREPPLTPPSWRLIGSSSSGGKRNLIILRQGKSEPEFYRTGDKLPGGYVIGEITDEDVTLIHGKQAVMLSYIGTR